MRSCLLLVALAGLALAARQSGWKDNTEYVYNVRGRTMTSLDGLSDQYSGLFLKANLHIVSRADGKLQAWISEPQYAQVHSQMSDGWNSNIPDSQLAYKQLGLTKKPFQIVTESGMIRGLIIEKEVTNWEANILKSIVSQFQLDLQGNNVVQTPGNILPTGEKAEGMFKTMEETVTGRTETEYDIHELPEYLLQSFPWLAPQQNLKGDGKIFEVVKSKNYTNSPDMPAYHYGFGEMKEGKPASNKMGQFLTRQSTSRIVLSGKLSKYTIQSSQTTNKIVIKPSFDVKVQGSAVSFINVTLSAVKTQTQQQQDLADPIEIGNLVYTYECPFAKSSELRQKLQGDQLEADSREDSNGGSWQRFRRSAVQAIRKMHPANRDAIELNQQVQYQPKPDMSEVPELPLLPYYMGYHGTSVKNNKDFSIKQNAQRIANEISEDLQDPEKILSQSTLSKYVMLVSLIRLMNQQDIEWVAQQLYTQNKQGKQYNAWVAYRDAVSEAGTGPAFQSIEQWISTRKVTKQEAAVIVSSMANSVRVPTEEYMHQFFDMLKKPEVSHQEIVNETAILSFTSLLHKVYVNKQESQNQYPVHSFRSFRTKQGLEFVKETVIPYLTQQLEEAVSEADSRKIHVYIRALGNVGHKNIIKSYEPYLEGEKQMSQFQRLLIVLSLDKLVETYPEIAQPVLYRLYQNVAESPEVRVAAVYQLMRTKPSAEMLQRMAQSTNIDSQEDVNAAVKSAIESASQLQSDESKSLRAAAESAKPLLTRKHYGKQRSQNILENYIIRNIGTELKQNLLQIGSSDSILPKGVKYTLRGNLDGLKHYFVNVQAMTSSIRELTNLLQMQTEEYKQSKNTREQKSSKDGQWSSSKIAEALNIEMNEREQLEGFIYSEIDGLQRMWSFDNQTVEQLPQAIRELEQILKNGKHFQYTKLRQLKDMAFSVPTEMGFPFLYTHDVPMLVQFEGNVKVRASPEASNGKYLRKPEQIFSEIEGSATISVKVDTRLSLVTPFDHQIYIAGFDRNVHAHLPVSSKVEWNAQNSFVKIEWDLNKKHSDACVFHYSSWPYTSRSDIMNPNPVALRPNTHQIKPENGNTKSFDFVFGKKETGVSIRVWGHQNQQITNLWQLASLVKSEGIVSALQQLLLSSSMQQSEISVKVLPQASTTRKCIFKFEMQKQYEKQPRTKQSNTFYSLDQLSSRAEAGSQQLQGDLLSHVSAGINNARSQCAEASVEFVGDKTYKHMFTFAMAKSNVAPQSRLIAFYKGDSQESSRMSFEVRGYVPNTNGLDLTTSLNTEPKANYEMIWQRSLNGEVSNIKGTVDMTRSGARKSYIVQHPMYQVCKQEMQEGNHQLYACQNMTIEANYLNDIEIKLQYENIASRHIKHFDALLNVARVSHYPMIEMNEHKTASQNEIYLRAELQPQGLRQLNATVRNWEEETKFVNISLGQLAKTILVSHPVFHLKSRLVGHYLDQDLVRPTCVIDETAAQTFNNRTYPLSLGDGWTVMMQYLPEQGRQIGQSRIRPSEQLKKQLENFLVLVRAVSEDHKEIKITFNHPTSEGKTVEVYMKYNTVGASSTVLVLVDGEEVQFDKNSAAEYFNGYLEIYGLPNDEFKVELQDWFYLIFDGERVKLTAISDKLYDSVIGLCGRFSEDKYEDFRTPHNCIVKSPQTFAESFQIRGKYQNQKPQDCIRKDLPLYTKVVSNINLDQEDNQSEQTSNGIRFRNRYIEQNGDICFTIHPVAECKTQPKRTTSKNVPVHCITKSKTAYYLKNQIDQGGNPDFSHKSETKSVQLEIHQDCY